MTGGWDAERMRSFEDFTEGTVTYGDTTVTEAAIIAFARDYDPQVFHIDPEAAKQSFAGGLIASGWQTGALMMRMLADHTLKGSTSMGAPGVEELKWLRPVRPGDRLSVRETVLGKRPSASRPEMGLVQFRCEVRNQRGETVQESVNWGLFGRHGAPPLPPRTPPTSGEAARVQPDAPLGTADLNRVAFFEDVRLDEPAVLGRHRFEPEEIIGFGRAYDPQPFHTDPEAARRSHFGGLCASGWHTAGRWMRAMVEHRRRAIAAVEARGERAAELGVSPGFRDLRWPAPTYAGDTLTFTSEAVEKRPSASRPGWGLVFSRNRAVNQRGEEVFSFLGGAFWERRRGVG